MGFDVRDERIHEEAKDKRKWIGMILEDVKKLEKNDRIRFKVTKKEKIYEGLAQITEISKNKKTIQMIVEKEIMNNLPWECETETVEIKFKKDGERDIPQLNLSFKIAEFSVSHLFGKCPTTTVSKLFKTKPSIECNGCFITLWQEQKKAFRRSPKTKEIKKTFGGMHHGKRKCKK